MPGRCSTPSLERRLQALKANRATREKKIGGPAPAPAPAPVPARAPAPAPAPEPEPAAPARLPEAVTPQRAAAPVSRAADGLSADALRHREEKKALSDQVQSLNERLAHATAGTPAEAGEETARLHTEAQSLRGENAALRDEVRDVRGQLEDQRRAAKRKVAELENLLRHVTEELSRQGDAGKLRTDTYQLQEDNARLEEELNQAEARQEQTVAEYEQKLAVAEAQAPSSDELIRIKKEKAAIEIVMNQLGEELEEEKHKTLTAEKKLAEAGSGRPGSMVDNSALMAQQQMLADTIGAQAGGDPTRTTEALFHELDRAKSENRNQRQHIDDLEKDLRTAQYEREQSEDGKQRQEREAEASAKKKQLEYTGHLTELQMELAHVCNVLSVMDQNCKVLEVTQVDTDVLHLAHSEIQEKEAKIVDLNNKMAQLQQQYDALGQQLQMESDKRSQYEQHIIEEEKKKKQMQAHLDTTMQSMTMSRTMSMQPPPPGGGQMPYGGGSAVGAPAQYGSQYVPQYAQQQQRPPASGVYAPERASVAGYSGAGY